MISSIFFSLLFLGFSADSTVFNNQTERYTISGTVRSGDTGESLPNATVQIKGTRIGTTTNADGRFVLVDLEPDSLVLRISYIGYHTEETHIVPGEVTTPILIELEPSTIILDGVEAVAESFRFIQHARNISQVTLSPRDISYLPNIGETDIFRSLQLLPGIGSTNESSAGLYVRGGTPDQNLMLLDGIPVYHVDHFFGFFSAFNAKAIKDVQLYKSGYPARYGGRVSGVVDMSGITGNMNRVSGSAGINLLSTGMHLEVPLAGRGSAIVAARRSYTDFLKTGLYNRIYETLSGERGNSGGPGRGGRVIPLDGTRSDLNFDRGGFLQNFQPDFYFYDLNARATYLPSDRDILTVSFYTGRDNLDRSREQSSQGIGGGQLRGDPNVQMPEQAWFNHTDNITEWGNLGFSSKWSRQWASRFYTNALISRSVYDSDYHHNFSNEVWNVESDSLISGFSTGTVENNRIADMSFRIDNEWQISQNHKFEFGVNLTRNYIDYHHALNDTIRVLGRDQEATIAAAYVQDRWTIFDGFDLKLGLRGVHYDKTGTNYLEPRASFYWTFTENWALKGAFGEYNQFVNRIINEDLTEGTRDFWLLADGDLIDVVRSAHYAAGISYNRGSWLIDAEVFHKDIDGITEFTRRFSRQFEQVTAPEELFVSGEGLSRGIEFLLMRQAGRFTGWSSYTLSKTEHTISVFNDGNPFPALHDQRHELNLVGHFTAGNWNFSANWIYGSGSPYTAPQGTYTLELLDGTEVSFIHVGPKNGYRLPAYHRLDIAAYYTFDTDHADIILGFSIFNFYNRRNIWYREYNFQVSPFQITDVRYMGIAPNLSLEVNF